MDLKYYAYLDRLVVEYEIRIEHENRVIKEMESGKMRTFMGGTDTTAESVERAQHAVESYRRGIEVMRKNQADLLINR